MFARLVGNAKECVTGLCLFDLGTIWELFGGIKNFWNAKWIKQFPNLVIVQLVSEVLDVNIVETLVKSRTQRQFLEACSATTSISSWYR